MPIQNILHRICLRSRDCKSREEVLLAIGKGVNYFDTAYIYSGSEECLGRILDENKCRDRVYIATKLPQYIIRSAAAIDKIFNEELSRLRTDHIDYYLDEHTKAGKRGLQAAAEKGIPVIIMEPLRGGKQNIDSIRLL